MKMIRNPHMIEFYDVDSIYRLHQGKLERIRGGEGK